MDAFTCNPSAVTGLLTSSYFRTHGQLLTFDPCWWVPIGQCPARHLGWDYIKTFWGNNKRDSLSPWSIEYRIKPLNLSTCGLFERPEYTDKRLYIGTLPNEATRATNVTGLADKLGIDT